MTLRSLTAAIAVAAGLYSCTIKEERELCPCRLTVDLSEAPEDDGTVGITAWNTDKQIAAEEVNIHENALYSCDVPRGMVYMAAFTGLDRCTADGRNVLIPEGCESDRIMTYSGQVECIGEQVFAKAEFHKGWATLAIEWHSRENGPCPFRFKVTGNVNGLDLMTLEPVAGKFSYEPQDSGQDGNSASVSLPRQPVSPDDGRLVLHLMRKSDNETVRRHDLSEMIAATGFDWTAENLDDIRIVIGVNGSISSVSVLDWETGRDTEVTI